jgi:ABC-type multidrug transport system fused ATPase/permease subunit
VLTLGLGGNCCKAPIGRDILSRIAFEGIAPNIPSNFEGFKRIESLIIIQAYFAIFKALLILVKDCGNTYFVQRFRGGLRRKVLDAFLVQDMGFFDARPAGVLLSRIMNDIDNVQGVAVVFSIIFNLIMTVATSANVAFDLNPSLMVLFLALIPFEVFVNSRRGIFDRQWIQRLNNRMGAHYQTMQEILDKIKHIKVFNGVDAAVQQFSNSLVLNYRISAFMFYVTNFGYDLFLALYQNVFNFSLMYISARLMLPRLQKAPNSNIAPFSGFLNYGQYTIFEDYATKVKTSLTSFYNTYQRITKVFVMGQTMCYFLYRKPLGGGEKVQGQGYVDEMQKLDCTIRFENVSFAYPSRPGVPVLKQFSCTFPAKKFSCIIGNSGGGKSTTMSLILRMYEPSSGTLWLGNHEFNTINLTFLRDCFAYVTQQPVMFSQTIRENLLYANPKASNDEIRHALQEAGCTGIIDSLPDGLETKLAGEECSYISSCICWKRHLSSVVNCSLQD